MSISDPFCRLFLTVSSCSAIRGLSPSIVLEKPPKRSSNDLAREEMEELVPYAVGLFNFFRSDFGIYKISLSSFSSRPAYQFSRHCPQFLLQP